MDRHHGDAESGAAVPPCPEHHARNRQPICEIVVGSSFEARRTVARHITARSSGAGEVFLA